MSYLFLYLSSNFATCLGENGLCTEENDSYLLPGWVWDLLVVSFSLPSADFVYDSTIEADMTQSFKIAIGLNACFLEASTHVVNTHSFRPCLPKKAGKQEFSDNATGMGKHVLTAHLRPVRLQRRIQRLAVGCGVWGQAEYDYIFLSRCLDKLQSKVKGMPVK